MDDMNKDPQDPGMPAGSGDQPMGTPAPSGSDTPSDPSATPGSLPDQPAPEGQGDRPASESGAPMGGGEGTGESGDVNPPDPMSEIDGHDKTGGSNDTPS